MKATEMLHILKVQNKRLFIIWLVTFIAFIGLLGYTVYLLNDIGVVETTTTVEQSNAVNKFEDDCVIRAISCATGKSWDYVYDYLSDIAQYEGTLFDKKDFVKSYLDRTYERIDGLQGTVGYISSLFPNNTLLITMQGHIVCSKNGVIYDTFDCRNREAEFVWLVR